MNTQAIVKEFAFEGQPVRIELIDGEPWWVARDVATSLEYPESSSINSLMAKIPEDWKGAKRIGTLGGIQEMLCLSERGLYFFLARSDKPRALPFQKWIAGEVLPSIRKTGKYGVIPEDPTLLGLPDFRDPIKAAEGWIVQYQRADDAELKVQILQAKAEANAPLVDFAERVERCVDGIPVGLMAKLIQQGTGYKMGQNRFFKYLRDRGYVHASGHQRNLPTQRSLDSKWIVVQLSTWTDRHGNECECKTSLVTGRGQIYFMKLFSDLVDAEERASQNAQLAVFIHPLQRN